MSLLHYLKPVGGLPDPRRSLSSSIPAQVIAEANKEVQKVAGSMDGHKCGPYTQYSSTLYAEIAKYACQHGAVVAVQHFLKKLKKPVSESIVKSVKKDYVGRIAKVTKNKRRRRNNSSSSKEVWQKGFARPEY